MLFGAFFGGWEVILILLILLIFFGAKGIPPFIDGLGKGMKEFLKATDDVTSQIQNAGRRNGAGLREGFSFRVFIAQGFGIGRVPFAPGTFGSFAGLLWFALLASMENFWVYLTLAIEGIAFSLWLCDDAEKILGEQDPPSVVLDEIIAIPFCFLPWMAIEWWQHDSLPEVSSLFTGRALWMTIGIIAAFRVFDIWKPWPVRQIQRLPGGWGVTADDLLAAVYVALISVPFVLY